MLKCVKLHYKVAFFLSKTCSVSKNSREVMDLLCQLHEQGTTIVMVTHSQHNASYADRIINLYDGRIVEQAEL